MKAFTFKDNSWHFWVANFGERRVRPEWGATDICEYTRSFLKGLFWLAVATAMLTALAFFILGSFGNIIGVFAFGYKLEAYTIAFLIINFAGLAAFGVQRFVTYLEDRRNARYEAYRRGELKEPEPKEPGFLTLAYRKFKDKTCFRIVIEKTND